MEDPHPSIPTGPKSMSVETELLVCPYNPAHSILRHRMQTHLHKCRKQHQSADYAYCSHNGTHHMPRMELTWHEDYMCPDRHSFQASGFSIEPTGYETLVPIRQIDLPELEENWDDGPINTFDPQQNAASKSLIRGVCGVPPSERKAFKLEHRRRVNADDGEEVATRANLRTETRKQPKQANEGEPLKPLRPPKELPKGFSFARGKKITSEDVSRSPGVVENLSNLSLNSKSSSSAATIGSSTVSSSSSFQTDQISWTGLGRGSPMNPNPLPPSNAWGRGQSKS